MGSVRSHLAPGVSLEGSHILGDECQVECWSQPSKTLSAGPPEEGPETCMSSERLSP